MCSTEVAKILLEIEGQAMKNQKKPKPIPKDHAKENIKRLKEIHANSKKREQEPKGLPFKAASDKYSGVQSKVALSLQSARLSPTSPPRKVSEIAIAKIVPSIKLKTKENESTVALACAPRTVKRSSSLSEISPEPQSRETTPLVRRELQRSPSSTALATVERKSSHQIGKVPKYLIERRKQWQEEEEKRRKSAPDPTVPPGHTLLSEKERLETLTLLQKTHQGLLRQMASLPVRTDTLRLKQRKEDIEKQLAQTEEAIVMFSRPRVLIKHDS